MLVRWRRSTVSPEQVTGYSVGLAQHTAADGAGIWYGGGKLAADLTLPKLRARWATSTTSCPVPGRGLSAAAARAVLRSLVTAAAGQATNETDFFARLRDAGADVRVRFSQTDPGQVTGYSVTLPRHVGHDAAPLWYGGGRLAAGLTLPRLRDRWGHGRRHDPGRPVVFRFTAPERNAIFGHASRQAAAAAEHIRCCAHSDPAGAADAAWAAADALHAAARALRSSALRCAADAYDRAARAPHGRIPSRTRDGDLLRTTARLMARLGYVTGDCSLASAALIANLAALAAAVGELRQAQRHAAQAAAARATAAHLHAAMKTRPVGSGLGQLRAPQRSRTKHTERVRDFPAQPMPAWSALVPQSRAGPRLDAGHSLLLPRRRGPAP